MSRRIYLSVEQPDQEATIEFLSFHPEAGVRVAGVTIRAKLEYNPATQQATFYVYAVDAGDAKILLDDLKYLSVDLD